MVAATRIRLHPPLPCGTTSLRDDILPQCTRQPPGGSGSRPFARFPPSHLRNAARIVSSQARLKSNCSAIAEIRFMNSPMRMSEDCISLALDQRGRVLLRPKSEQCRKHRVVSQPVDVDVPRKSADDREHSRADDQAWRWRRFKTAFMRCRWMWEGTTAGAPSRTASSGPDVARSAGLRRRPLAATKL